MASVIVNFARRRIRFPISFRLLLYLALSANDNASEVVGSIYMDRDIRPTGKSSLGIPRSRSNESLRNSIMRSLHRKCDSIERNKRVLTLPAGAPKHRRMRGCGDGRFTGGGSQLDCVPRTCNKSNVSIVYTYVLHMRI